jgi:uncharacterized protein (DUF488 family)
VTVESISHRIYTVGHSNHTVTTFLGLLQQHGVTTIADVRSAPYSRFAPQFSSGPLRDSLRNNDIKYASLGRELGARSSDPSCYEDGRVQYERLARTEPFHAGIDRLIHGSHVETVAILCTEKDPLDCHRTLLVSRSLVEHGLHVDHIIADGSLESYENSMLRLLDKTNQPPPDFFTTLDERIDKARRDQEARIAYVDKELAAASAERAPS